VNKLVILNSSGSFSIFYFLIPFPLVCLAILFLPLSKAQTGSTPTGTCPPFISELFFSPLVRQVSHAPSFFLSSHRVSVPFTFLSSLFPLFSVFSPTFQIRRNQFFLNPALILFFDYCE